MVEALSFRIAPAALISLYNAAKPGFQMARWRDGETAIPVAVMHTGAGAKV